MANPEHLALLQRALTEPDASSWNSWRAENPEITLDLSDTDLHGLRFEAFDFRRSNLGKSFLAGCRFLIPLLTDADMKDAIVGNTIFADLDLSTVSALETVRHQFRSLIDNNTIYKSKGKIPEIFLRGCGAPEAMLAFARSLAASV
jgi:uncharacterized protein YjbI with pentapeptide repeats